MSRDIVVTLLLIIVATLLAVALFVAGAIWRGRTTARLVADVSRAVVATAATVDVSATGPPGPPWPAQV
jgi:hypothetical protein